MLDHADRLGILVIDDTAAVGLNLSVGAGLFGGGPRQTFSDDTIDSATRELHRRAVGELIASDRNHPCVVLWSVANEPESHTEESRTYFEPLFEFGRPTRPARSASSTWRSMSPHGEMIPGASSSTTP